MIRFTCWTVSTWIAAIALLAMPITAGRTLRADLPDSKPPAGGPKTTKKTVVKTTKTTTVETIEETIEEPTVTKTATPSEASPRGTRESRPPLLSAAEKEDVKRVQRGNWLIFMNLDMPGLEPQAVQYAVLDEDPVPAFIAGVKRMRASNRQQVEKANNEARKEQLHSIQMKVSWDLGFREVTGDKLYLLTKRPGNSISSLTSNSPGGRKWIVTKTVDIKGKPVCWSIPVQVKSGESITVTLENGNTFDLRTPYNKAMEVER